MHHIYTETKQTSLHYEQRLNMLRKLKRVEMEFPMTTQEPVDQVKPMEMVITLVLTKVQTTSCLTLTIVEVPLEVQV